MGLSVRNSSKSDGSSDFCILQLQAGPISGSSGLSLLFWFEVKSGSISGFSGLGWGRSQQIGNTSGRDLTALGSEITHNPSGA